MMDPVIKNKLDETFETCQIHLKQLNFARSKVEAFIPLHSDSYWELTDETISYLDQFIYRFSKLQDVMESRLFPDLLTALAEPIENLAFIDILNRLEKLELIPSAQDWIQLRKIRNDMAHEYPSSLGERIEGINFLFEKMDILQTIVEKCRLFLIQKLNIHF